MPLTPGFLLSFEAGCYLEEDKKRQKAFDDARASSVCSEEGHASSYREIDPPPMRKLVRDSKRVKSEKRTCGSERRTESTWIELLQKYIPEHIRERVMEGDDIDRLIKELGAPHHSEKEAMVSTTTELSDVESGYGDKPSELARKWEHGLEKDLHKQGFLGQDLITDLPTQVDQLLIQVNSKLKHSHPMGDPNHLHLHQLRTFPSEEQGFEGVVSTLRNDIQRGKAAKEELVLHDLEREVSSAGDTLDWKSAVLSAVVVRRIFDEVIKQVTSYCEDCGEALYRVKEWYDTYLTSTKWQTGWRKIEELLDANNGLRKQVSDLEKQLEESRRLCIDKETEAFAAEKELVEIKRTYLERLIESETRYRILTYEFNYLLGQEEGGGDGVLLGFDTKENCNDTGATEGVDNAAPEDEAESWERMKRRQERIVAKINLQRDLTRKSTRKDLESMSERLVSLRNDLDDLCDVTEMHDIPKRDQLLSMLDNMDDTMATLQSRVNAEHAPSERRTRGVQVTAHVSPSPEVLSSPSSGSPMRRSRHATIASSPATSRCLACGRSGQTESQLSPATTFPSASPVHSVAKDISQHDSIGFTETVATNMEIESDSDVPVVKASGPQSDGCYLPDSWRMFFAYSVEQGYYDSLCEEEPVSNRRNLELMKDIICLTSRVYATSPRPKGTDGISIPPPLQRQPGIAHLVLGDTLDFTNNGLASVVFRYMLHREGSKPAAELAMYSIGLAAIRLRRQEDLAAVFSLLFGLVSASELPKLTREMVDDVDDDEEDGLQQIGDEVVGAHAKIKDGHSRSSSSSSDSPSDSASESEVPVSDVESRKRGVARSTKRAVKCSLPVTSEDILPYDALAYCWDVLAATFCLVPVNLSNIPMTTALYVAKKVDRRRMTPEGKLRSIEKVREVLFEIFDAAAQPEALGAVRGGRRLKKRRKERKRLKKQRTRSKAEADPEAVAEKKVGIARWKLAFVLLQHYVTETRGIDEALRAIYVQNVSASIPTHVEDFKFVINRALALQPLSYGSRSISGDEMFELYQYALSLTGTYQRRVSPSAFVVAAARFNVCTRPLPTAQQQLEVRKKLIDLPARWEVERETAQYQLQILHGGSDSTVRKGPTSSKATSVKPVPRISYRDFFHMHTYIAAIGKLLQEKDLERAYAYYEAYNAEIEKAVKNTDALNAMRSQIASEMKDKIFE
eukprot:Rmarinus@m.29325